MIPLYDNREGWTEEALRLFNEAKEAARLTLQEHPEHNALELSAVLHAAIDSARSEVPIRRRLDPNL